MKHSRKALALMILLVTPLLLSGIIVPVDFEAKTTLTQNPIKVSLPSYEVISPIRALNDTAMDYYASLLTWEGNGQPDTPYIIEGYNITSDSECINIEQTSRAFEIRNCYLSSWSGYNGYGIDIDNVTQGAVFDSVIEGKDLGIIVSSTPAFAVNNCTIHGGDYGVDLESSHGGQITGCHFYENLVHGIYIFQSNNTMIAENEIHDSLDYGIFLSGAHYTIIQNNLVTSCNGYGLNVGTSHYVVVENNIFRDTVYGPSSSSGIYLDRSPFASIVGNEIYNNSRNGIYVSNSDEVYIFDNEIYGNSDHGIDVMASDNGTILENNIHGNGWSPVVINAPCGIFLGPSQDWVISGNSIWNNTPSGISLESAENVEIVDNDIYDNTDTGIYAFGPGYQDVNIRENEVYGNGHEDRAPQSNGGILLAAYENCTLEGNHLYNNTDRGIAIQGSENTVIGNTVYNTSGSGIEVIMVFDCLISENIVYDCEDGILLYSIGSNATDNIVYDNEVGISLYGSQSCYIYGNDVGWNNENALEEGGMLNNMWYNDVTEEGNHWHDYNGVGIYWISNGTHSVTSDDYPSISLNLTQANSISYEILETGNFIEWDAYALNPSHYEVFVDGSSVLVEDWDGNNIEYLADGLSHGTHTIEVIVYHISGHSMNNLTTADVEDLTPPDLDGPTIIETTVGGFFNVQYTASDPSGIASWAVNDTRFVIDSSGVLSRVGDIPAGEHVILIQVTDTLGHTASLEVSVLVSGGGIDTILALSLGGGAIVVLIVVIVFLKKKQT